MSHTTPDKLYKRLKREIITDLLRRTKLKGAEIKKLCESQNPRDAHHFYKGFKAARHLLDNISAIEKRS